VLSFIVNENPSAVLVFSSCFIAFVAREIQPEMSLTPSIDQSSSGICRNQGHVAEIPCSYQGTCMCNQRASSVKIVIFVHLFRAPRIYNYAVPVGTISTLIAMHAVFNAYQRRLVDVADSMAFSSRHASLAYVFHTPAMQ
jgi:hypothetical protein